MNPELYTDRGMYLDSLSKYIEHQNETEKAIMEEIFKQWETGIYDQANIKNRLCMKFSDRKTREINKTYKKLLSYIQFLEKETKPSIDNDKYYFKQILGKVLMQSKNDTDKILTYAGHLLSDIEITISDDIKKAILEDKQNILPEMSQKIGVITSNEVTTIIENKIKKDIPQIIKQKAKNINTYYLDDDLKKHFYSKGQLVYQKLLCRTTGQLLELVGKKITEDQLLQEQEELEEAKRKEAIRQEYPTCFSKDHN